MSSEQPVPVGAEAIPASRGRLRALILTMRPHQWVKNLFVAAPVLFSKNLLYKPMLLRAAIAFGLFCVLSGAVYLINDVVDVDKDRAHPRKRFRPIASGQLPLGLAKNLAIVFALGAIGAGAFLSPWFAVTAGAYFILNLGYSLQLKHVVFIDVLLIAAGFLLRVVSGALAIAVEPSYWLLACTALLACFLGFGKRYHELVTAGERGSAARRVLEYYRLDHLQWLMQILAIATVGAYVMYTLGEHTVQFFHTRHMVWTAPFIAIGVIRFQWLVVNRPRAESPTEEMLRDPLFLGNLALWCAAVIFIIYFAK